MSNKEKYNMLTPLEFIESRGKYYSKYWNFKCDCGNIKIIRYSHVTSGKIKSCGCLRQTQGCHVPITKGEQNHHWTGYKLISGSFWNRLLRNASSRNIDISIDKIYINNLLIQQGFKCALTGLDLLYDTTSSGLKQGLCTASLDRIDNTKGYIKGNVQWVHKDINYMKQDFTISEFNLYCELVYKMSIQKVSQKEET